MEKFIKLSIDRIKLFNLPIDIKDEQIGIVISVNSVKETENEIVIDISYWDQELNEETKQINLSYNKNKLSPYDYILIGWIYIVYYFTEKGEHYINTAKEFLIKSIKKGVNSCLPHYLLANFPLNYIEGVNRVDNLYSALDDYDDTFPDFYSFLYMKDENKIRAVGVLKKGLEKFPTSFILNYHLSNYLIRKKNYKEALKFLRNINSKEYKNYGSRFLIDLFYNVFMCNINLGDFDEAERTIKNNVVFNKYRISLLNGLLEYHKSEFETASNYFLECIQKNLLKVEGYCSYYYLLDCYVKLKKYDLLNDILSVIPDENIDYIDYYLNMEFLDLAESCLEEIIELDIDEMSIARAKGLLASIILYERLPNFIYEPRRILTKKEKNLLEKTESLIKNTLNFYPTNQFFLTTFSDVLFIKGKFDESMIVKLKSLECRIYDQVSETYTNISLENCTEIFINNYKNRIEKIFFKKKELKEIYVKEQLQLDIEDLFSMKRYDVINNLYFYLRGDIDFDNSDYLFEIAYSLREEEYVDEAETIYNKIVEREPKNTSVLNNLAIIFEKKGELDKAIDLIKTAKDLNQKDIVIINNFNRITGLVKPKKGKKREIKFEIKQKLKLHFDTEKSRIFYGNKFCEIPISTYEYYLCKAIFSKPLGAKIPEEEIFEVLDRAKLEERSRTIYDTCRRINKKVESSLGLKKILINRGAMIWIRDEFIK